MMTSKRRWILILEAVVVAAILLVLYFEKRAKSWDELMRLGTASFRQGDLAEAEEYFEMALAKAKTRDPGDPEAIRASQLALETVRERRSPGRGGRVPNN